MNLKHFLLFCLLALPIRADFIAVGGGQIYRINEQTGSYQTISSAASAGYPAALTRDPQTNTFYAVGLELSGAGRLFTINPDTGQASLIAPLSQSNLYIEALAFAPNGLLYATSQHDTTLYTIDPHTGSVARVGTMQGAFQWVYGLAFAPDGTLYGYTNSEGELGHYGPGFFRLNLATAVPTVLGSGSLGNVLDIAFAPDGTLWAASGTFFAPISTQTGNTVGLIRDAGVRIAAWPFCPTPRYPSRPRFSCSELGCSACALSAGGTQSRSTGGRLRIFYPTR